MYLSHLLQHFCESIFSIKLKVNTADTEPFFCFHHHPLLILALGILTTTQSEHFSHTPGDITWPFIGDWLIPGSLFTFLSRWPTGWLSELVGRNWFTTILTTTRMKRNQSPALSFMTWCWAAKCGQSHMQTVRYWHGQLTTTDLARCHPLWHGNCQSWSVLKTNFAPRHHS